MELRDLLEETVKLLVDVPEQVRVGETETGRVLVLEIHLAPSDIAKVIGKHGRTIEALRTVAINVGAKLGKRVMVEVIEPDRPPSPTTALPV